MLITEAVVFLSHVQWYLTAAEAVGHSQNQSICLSVNNDHIFTGLFRRSIVIFFPKSIYITLQAEVKENLSLYQQNQLLIIY